MTPVWGFFTITGWHGSTSQRVLIVGSTPLRFRIRAIVRTRLAGRGRWLEAGQEALVPLHAVRCTGELHDKPPGDVRDLMRANQ